MNDIVKTRLDSILTSLDDEIANYSILIAGESQEFNSPYDALYEKYIQYLNRLKAKVETIMDILND